MGCRGNIVSIDNNSPIYFYTHWEGDQVYKILHKALQKSNKCNRLSDEPYTNRIIFCSLVGDKEDWDETTGYGISTYITDNEYPLIVVNFDKKLVYIKKEGTDMFTEENSLITPISISEFANLTDEQLDKILEPVYEEW